jgi:hypothetical protein
MRTWNRIEDTAEGEEGGYPPRWHVSACRAQRTSSWRQHGIEVSRKMDEVDGMWWTSRRSSNPNQPLRLSSFDFRESAVLNTQNTTVNLQDGRQKLRPFKVHEKHSSADQYTLACKEMWLGMLVFCSPRWQPMPYTHIMDRLRESMDHLFYHTLSDNNITHSGHSKAG